MFEKMKNHISSLNFDKFDRDLKWFSFLRVAFKINAKMIVSMSLS